MFDEVVESGLIAIPRGFGAGEESSAKYGIIDHSGRGWQISPADMNGECGLGHDVGQPVPRARRPSDEEATIKAKPPDLDPDWRSTSSPDGRDVDGPDFAQGIEVTVHGVTLGQT